jgi:hypothetical protein
MTADWSITADAGARARHAGVQRRFRVRAEGELSMTTTVIAHNDWEIWRGTDLRFDIVVRDDAGDPTDISAASVRYVLGPSKVETAYLDLNSADDPDNVFITDDDGGAFSVRLTPALTTSLPAGSAWHEFVVTLADEQVQYVAAGRGRIVDTLVAA